MATKRSTGVGLHVEGADKFRAELNKANSAIRLTNAEVKKLDATYGKGSTNSDYLTQRTQALTKQLDSQQKKTATLREQLAAYEATGKTTTAQVEKYRLEILKSETAEENLKRQINEANSSLKEQSESTRTAETAEKGLEKQVEKTSQAINKQDTAVKKSGTSLEDYAKKAGRVGDALTRALTLPIAGMGTYSLNAAMELEDAMASVQTLPGVVSGTAEQQAAQMEAYTDAILAASNATHTAAEELAAAQYQAISAGADASESVAMVEKSAKAAKAGMSEVTTVVDGATSILNAWKDSAGGIDHVLDAMMVTQNEGKTNIGELASNIGQVTGLAPQLGVALDEVLAATAALTKAGVSTSSSINGLKAVFSNILKPTSEATEEAKRLGLQFDATALRAQGFTGFLQSVMNATNGDSESLAKLFGSVEGLSQIMALGTTQADEYARILMEIENSAGAVDEAFAVRTSSRAEKLKGSMNELRNSGIQLAENLYPAVDAVTDLIGGTASVIGNMDEGTQKALVNILGVAAAIGPTTKAVAGLTSAVAKLIPLLTGPWGLAAAGAILVGGLVLDLANAGTAAKRLEHTIETMELAPDAEKLASLTGQIQAAIDAVDEELSVFVTAEVDADLSGLDELTDGISEKLKQRLKYAMTDEWLTWAEYDRLNGMLGSQDFRGVADAGLSTGSGRLFEVAQEMTAAIDAAEQLLWAVFVTGDSVTAQEIAQLQELMERIAAYREQLLTTQNDVDATVSTIGGEIQQAMENNRLELAEYEEIKRLIDEEARPDAVAAMEDAAVASIGAELDSTLTEFEALLDAINDRGGAITEKEIAQINQYLTEIESLNARIDDLQGLNAAVNTVLSEDPAYKITVAGYGTDDTAAEAAGKVEGARRWQQAQVDADAERIKEQYKADQAAAETSEERQALKTQYEEEIAALEMEREAIDANAQRNLNAVFEGWLKGEAEYQQEAANIREIGALIDAFSLLKDAEPSVEAFRTLYESGALNREFRDTGRSWGHMYDLTDASGGLLAFEDIMAMAAEDEWVARDLEALVGTAGQEIHTMIERAMQAYDGTDSPLLAMYQAWIDSGIDVENLDVTQAEGTLADIMRLLLLHEEGVDSLGSEAMEAIGSGISEAAPEAIATAEDAASQIGDAATNLADGTAAGRNLALSLAAGIRSGSPAAVAAAQDLANQVSAVMNGAYTYSPGATLPAVAAGGGATSNSYDFSTNVSVGTGVFTSTSDVSAMAERLNTHNRLKMAGVGQIARA